MAQEGDFKHISLTAAQDDDEVVVAGAPLSPVEAEGSSAVGDADLSSEEAFAQEELAACEPPSSKQPGDGASSASKARQAQAAWRGSSGYRETTLEDLESTPMPLAQRIVIVAAVVCIIGAIVYYFAVMR